jgi:hypothetical protein
MSEVVESSSDGLQQISVDGAAISEQDKVILNQWVDAAHQGAPGRFWTRFLTSRQTSFGLSTRSILASSIVWSRSAKI